VLLDDLEQLVGALLEEPVSLVGLFQALVGLVEATVRDKFALELRGQFKFGLPRPGLSLLFVGRPSRRRLAFGFAAERRRGALLFKQGFTFHLRVEIVFAVAVHRV
jgi:hypothetical protein